MMTLPSRGRFVGYTVCSKEFTFRRIGGANAKDVSMSPGFEIEQDLYDYLQCRASETGMDFWDAYNEEMEARVVAANEAFTTDELHALVAATASYVPLLDDNEDEECPF
jgi:hypothetical protein